MIEMKPQGGEPSTGYERRDVRTGLLALIAVVLFASVLVIMLGTWWYQGALGRGGPGEARVPGTIPSPRLQTAPAGELGTYLARQQQELSSYGWIDRESGLVRLPVSRAMELLAQRGLPGPGAPRTPLDMRQDRAGKSAGGSRP